MRQLYTMVVPVSFPNYPGVHSNSSVPQIKFNNSNNNVKAATEQLANRPGLTKATSATLPYNEETFKALEKFGFAITPKE
jgi:hypothetical protein